MYKLQVKIDGKWEYCNANETGVLSTTNEALACLAKFQALHPKHEYQIMPSGDAMKDEVMLSAPGNVPSELKANSAQRSEDMRDKMAELRAADLRDEIAVGALMSSFRSGAITLGTGPGMMKTHAHKAYQYADAMLEARAVKDDKP